MGKIGHPIYDGRPIWRGLVNSKWRRSEESLLELGFSPNLMPMLVILTSFLRFTAGRAIAINLDAMAIYNLECTDIR